MRLKLVMVLLIGSTLSACVGGFDDDYYVAGPYAEGSYEFTFPVDSAVIDAVKPEYVAAFSRAPQKQPRNSAD